MIGQSGVCVGQRWCCCLLDRASQVRHSLGGYGLQPVDEARSLLRDLFRSDADIPPPHSHPLRWRANRPECPILISAQVRSLEITPPGVSGPPLTAAENRAHCRIFAYCRLYDSCQQPYWGFQYILCGANAFGLRANKGVETWISDPKVLGGLNSPDAGPAWHFNGKGDRRTAQWRFSNGRT